ncbi:MAG: hypothetical protein RI897_82 [Verrucomicrobiota bacterium]
MEIVDGNATPGNGDIGGACHETTLPRFEPSLVSAVLRVVNSAQTVREAVHRVVQILRKATGMEAVAIRLQQDEDFPYVATEGFSPEFVAAENSVASRNPDGTRCRDAGGAVQLECTCGLVLGGRADPKHPLLTPRGSAWTNQSRQLAEQPKEIDPRHRPRNRCIHDGYASIALIPIRAQGVPVGLLQLNHRREGCFDPATISMLEDIGDDLGVALERLRTAEQVSEMDARLREANDLMQLILGHTHIMTVYLDRQFNFIWVNQAYANACRQEPAFFPGKNHFDLYPHAENEAIFRRVLDSGEPYFVTAKPFTFPDQPERGVTYWDWSLVPVLHPDAGVTGLVLTLSEVTERKRAEEEGRTLAEQNRQLQKSESLGRMASAIAHHFNNKLQAVIMSLDLARTAATENVADMMEALDRAEQAALQTADVSKMMLTYLGQSLSRMAPIDLAQTARGCLPILKAGISRRVVLDARLDEAGPVVESNADLIRQVLVNLVTNAGEALSGGAGTVCIRIGSVSADSIPATNRYPVAWKPTREEYGCLEVKDDGCGISEADLEKLFDPFFSTRFVGRGMGLSVVLGIVKAHAGCVTVDSCLHKGTTFRVFLPLAAKPVVSADVLDPIRALPPDQHGSVLMVDDETALRLACVAGLRRQGWSVLEAEDGPSALRLFQKHQNELACVVCDLTMPGLSGWDVLESVRQMRPGIPFILISGYGESQAMTDERAEKPSRFLSKPFSVAALGQCIAHISANRQ